MKYNYVKWIIDKYKFDPKNNKMDRWFCDLLERNNRSFYKKFPEFLEYRRRVRIREFQGAKQSV